MDFLPGLSNLSNVHPIFVHFPIALVLTALFTEALWWVTKKDGFRAFVTYLLYLAALSAVVTIITGYLGANSIGHDSPGHEFVHAHRDIMLIMGTLLLLTALLVLGIRSFREGKFRKLLIIPLLATSALMVYGADKGGKLVFSYGVGVQAVADKSAPGEGNEHHKHDGNVEQSGHETEHSNPESIEDGHAKSHSHNHED